jgi:undecaprenyl-diphosphatase
VFGVILGIADLIGAQRRRLDSLTVPHGILYGLAQSLALIPGVSRSGGTITAGLLMGYTREAAARYAFLLAIPAVFGSGLYELYKTVRTPGTHEMFTMAETATATVVAFAVALAVIAFFMKWISKHSFLPFVVYRVALGATLIVLLSLGVIPA